MFYANDHCKNMWNHKTDRATPQRKGKGPLIMISDFQTVDWGRLKDDIECMISLWWLPNVLTILYYSDAHVIFKAGKNGDGWFSADDLLDQVDHTIDIFKRRTNGFATGLFMFDNAPSHQKRAPDALSAWNMPKGPNQHWACVKDGPRMWPGMHVTGETQVFYYPNSHLTMPCWFKGMENIIWERGLWPANGLRAECNGFKCVPGCTNCCCCHLLFCQPDFIAQKSQLKEYVTSRGHICDFYPKFHCELNFIEMYWGAIKYCYHLTPRTSDIEAIGANVLACLEDVLLLNIKW